MVFSSILFLFQFFPAAMLLYFLTPRRYKNVVLLFLSLIFYAWGEPRYVLLMLCSILVDFTAGLEIEKFRRRPKIAKGFLFLSLGFNLGILGFFKYAGFLLENANALTGASFSPLSVTLPLGISFYTFQTLSYSIDVFRGAPAEKNPVDFGAFVCLFPQLIAGPIVKYSELRGQMKDRRCTPAQVEDGISYFILGLSGKVLLANQIGLLWNDLGELGYENISSPLSWLGIFAFGLQIYFDFSGYSLMAVGLGKMLGFEFPRNFDFPYCAKSVTEFWRRWHRTLGSWFREYVYIPLGGNRKGPWKTWRNLFIVWFLTGLWHGASWNFVLWGLLFLLLLGLEKSFLLPLLQKNGFFGHCYLIFFLLIGWVLFAIPDFSQMGTYFSRMFSLHFSGDILYYLRNYAAVLLLGAFFSTPVPGKIVSRLKSHRFLRAAGLLILFLFCTAYLADASYNPFLYFRF